MVAARHYRRAWFTAPRLARIMLRNYFRVARSREPLAHDVFVANAQFHEQENKRLIAR
jgi:hypothetical protein